MTGFWTEEREAELRNMHRAGQTYDEIAKHFGLNSRSAVSGKVNRMGMSGVRRTEHRADAAPKPKRYPNGTPGAGLRNGVGAQVQRINRAKAAPDIKPDPFVCREPLVELPPLHIGIAELTNSTCRYPFGDSDFTYCGHQPEDRSPYCGVHSRLCFNGVPVLKKPAVSDRTGSTLRLGGGRAA